MNNYFQESPDMFLGSSMEWDQLEGDCEETRVTNMTPHTETWRGVPLTEIYGAPTPWGASEFPLITPSYNHAVLFHIPQSGSTGVTFKPPTPQKGNDKWDKDSVRMPCSSQSLYPVEEEDGTTNLRQRWLMIEEALSQTICNSKELESAILSYNTKFKNQWKFKALHKLFDEYLEEEESEYFFNVTLPAMTKLALRLPELIQSPIPLLRQHKNRSVSLSQQQISCLLANAFFCTFPRRNTNKSNSEYSSYPDINFYRLFQSSNSTAVLEKLKCLCHYFRRVTTRVPCGVLTFSRRSIEASKCPDWATSDVLAGAAPLHVDSSGTIEDEGLGLIQIDFANKFLGGGVLNRGCVQEEIRFVICPELLVSTLFTEMLRPTEALLMIGCERYSTYSGYAQTFQWAGDFEDSTPHDTSSRRRCAVLAIDALQFSDADQQYRPELIKRELNKAWVGFSVYCDGRDGGLQYPGVGSGNWGCGAFGGSPALKSLLQVMACSQARRPLAYFTFGDVDLRNDIINIYNYISQNNITVGQLFEYLTAFYKSNVSKDELYSFLLQHHRDVTDAPTQAHTLTKTKPTSPPHTKCESKKSSTETLICKPELTKSPQKNSTNKLLSEKDIENSFVEVEAPFVDLEKGEAEIPEASDIKHRIISHKAKTPVKFKSKLFDEMTDYDETNSKLNLNKGSPLKYKTLSFLENETQSKVCQEKVVERREEIIEEQREECLPGILPENCDEVRSPKIPKVNPPTPTKKIARKITDYFIKKH